ncbi:hydrolase [Brucella sp. BO3]|uniref:hydrolase n=1 Tax=unclassified Brucella TaxID=2632610 RepID=UPI00084FAC67|nr:MULTISPECIES: hydrolase [unclassified Brucella]OEI84179.1 hydrolase [Brucella sp. B13-0095]QMV25979.1 hydrolase [Brucella sp. BO3]
MSKNDLQSRPERLVDQYREIGPAVLVAACKATHRTGNQQRSNLDRPSILAVKKPG